MNPGTNGRPIRPVKKGAIYWLGYLFGLLLVLTLLLGAAVAVKLLWVMLWA